MCALPPLPHRVSLPEVSVDACERRTSLVSPISLMHNCDCLSTEMNMSHKS